MRRTGFSSRDWKRSATYSALILRSALSRASRRMATELQHHMVRDGASRLLTMRSGCLSRQLSITHLRASHFGTYCLAAIANKSPQIYVQLSFLAYYSNCPCLDTEWLLSTLFDASLLSTLKPPATAALFLASRGPILAQRGLGDLNHKPFFNFS